MASKGKKPKSENDSAKPDTAPKESTPPAQKPTPSAEKPEVIPPQESIPPALAPSPKPKKEKQSSGLWGIILLFLLIVAGGTGAGGYYLYQEQMKFQNETLAKLSQLETQLSAMDTEADQARQNKQSIDSLGQELQQYKTEMENTLKSHQSTLATLDEDVMRLKEKVAEPVETPPAPPAIMDEAGTEAGPLPGDFAPETEGGETPGETESEEEDPNQESQKFVEWMENFFAAIWKWITGLFS